MAVRKKQMVIVMGADIEYRDAITAYFMTKNFNVACYDRVSVLLREINLFANCCDILLIECDFTETSFEHVEKELLREIPLVPVILVNSTEPKTEFGSLRKQISFYNGQKTANWSEWRDAVDQALRTAAITNYKILGTEEQASPHYPADDILGISPCFLAAVDLAKRVSTSTATILISGESGTGKEVFAKFIHRTSLVRKGPFIAINCSSIPEHLLESELFGHTKGAFTGAISNRTGLFEEAENGTLFLDEIGDLALSLQAKLLRVLQERTIKRVGENRSIPINCRIISATHKNLLLEIQEGRFRDDLYFRLNVIPIKLPPLRKRREDILLLAAIFLKKFAKVNASQAKTFSNETAKYLKESDWPGNVRELENTVERAVVLSAGPEISLGDLTSLSEPISKFDSGKDHLLSNDSEFTVDCTMGLPKLDEVINKFISYAVEKHSGARDKAARDIGIDRKTLYRRLGTTAVERPF